MKLFQEPTIQEKQITLKKLLALLEVNSQLI